MIYISEQKEQKNIHINSHERYTGRDKILTRVMLDGEAQYSILVDHACVRDHSFAALLNNNMFVLTIKH